ncbi:hypothetical protein CVIRNUC_009006 [Coccomyxa viridis]|uniref:DUF2415 domain-containing protein n=1 Tax=Coccomyxa viridis TaxID=1274662 RepID=A0AAV1IIE2_9CHLO|nr:hypothetical protein CVIRNUC_009006 [Coccomyxa viridis]
MEQTLVSPQPKYVLDQANTVQHWQLRDLIHAPDDEDSLFYVHGSKTRRLHTRTNEVETMQSYGIAPTAMTADHGYIAAGAQRGMLMVASTVDGSYVFCGEVGGSVVNALHFGRDPRGKLRLFVSNNDRQLRIFDMPSMRPVEAICCPAPINYAALSPEGDLLACVGDSGETHLFRAAPSGFVEYGSFTEAQDAGMTCAWNPSGTCLASGSQDGTVTIWDPRAHRRVAKLGRRDGEPGLSACRCVKFGNGPADLLAFNEHCSYTHIVDARDFQQEQVIDVDASIGALLGEPCALSGLAFTPSGQRIYVGVEGCEMDIGPHGIAAFDVQMLSRTTFGAAELA